MSIVISIGQWLIENYVQLFGILIGAIGLAEAITRITPTKKDDGFVERVGSFIRKIMDALRIPNKKKK